MGQVEMTRVWLETVVSSWRHRRSETGGVLDETGMIVVGVGAAAAIGAIVMTLIGGVEASLGDLWPGD